jgi:hypothetical protein
MVSFECHYCKNFHENKECPIEKQMVPYMKKIVGTYMEKIVASVIYCPRCDMKALNVLGTHAPSLDIICQNCNTCFEVKSKCMSTFSLPNDLKFNHGNYNDYLKRQNNGLDFLLIIYSVDRKTKILKMRQVFWIPNEIIISNLNIISIKKKYNSTLSEINIPNYHNIPEIILDKIYSYDFTNNINMVITTA